MGSVTVYMGVGAGVSDGAIRVWLWCLPDESVCVVQVGGSLLVRLWCMDWRDGDCLNAWRVNGRGTEFDGSVGECRDSRYASVLNMGWGCGRTGAGLVCVCWSVYLYLS